MNNRNSRLTVVSLFSGAGGLDLGLEAAGFETIYATDIDFHSCETLRMNKARQTQGRRSPLANAQIEQADLSETDGKSLLKKIGCSRGEVDLLAGGPPCQAFSVFGKRLGEDDPRGRLVYDYARILSDIQPKAFVLENVFGMLSVQGGQIFQGLIDLLQNPTRGLQYRLSVHRVNAMDYGVPQHRDRVFIIGSRADREVLSIPALCATKGSSLLTDDLLPHRTVAHALRGLPRIGSSKAFNHSGRSHSERIRKRYAEMGPGERDSFTRINRLDLTRPSYTIIVGSDKGGGKGHVHPTEPREVTPRESARMQTFPDWWEFSGTGRHVIRQVGNAVPSLLGYSVGAAIMRDLFDVRPTTFAEAVEFLGQEHLFPELFSRKSVAS